VTAGIFGFEAHHFEQLAERLQTAAARHHGETGRQSCHVIDYRRPIARFAYCGLIGHCDPCRRARALALIAPAFPKKYTLRRE